MRLDVYPPLGEGLLAGLEPVLRDAFASSGDTRSAAYASAWRRAAMLESVRNEPRPSDYALSPRSTRGATRA